MGRLAGGVIHDFNNMPIVSDNGCGMDRETLEMIFEPFFTTKEKGVGTGLGLSTVYGIIKQNGGFINVYSEQAEGTAFRIYLPWVPSADKQEKNVPSEEVPKGRGETILLVEDEFQILNPCRRFLEDLGYEVLIAGAPSEALKVTEEHAGKIHLLITDLILPEMNGRELAEKLLKIKPDMKCLFMSGYTANGIARHGVLEKGVFFLQKPLDMKKLAMKVCQALEQDRWPNRPGTTDR